MEVSFIIPNYNGKSCLKNCLDSIFSQNFDKKKFEVIVVDDNSSDESWKIAQSYKGVKLIRNNKNLRFVESNNIGIKAASGKYLALINNDVTLDSNWLNKMMKVIKEDEKIGVLGCKIFYGNSDKIWFGGAKVYFPGFIKHQKLDKRGPVDYVAFAAVIVRRAIFDKEYLDKNLIMYGEDSELCKRARLNNYKVIYTPEAIAYHNISSSRISENEEYFIQRNRSYYYTKFMTLPVKLLYLLLDIILFYQLFAIYRIFKNPYRIMFLGSILKARLDSIKLMLT